MEQQNVGNTPVVSLEKQNVSSPASIYSFAKIVGGLKLVKRTGWTHFTEIPHVESVADHSWRIGVLAMLFCKDPSINIDRCVKFALVHDIAESIVGDITPRDGVSAEDKKALEECGMEKILATIPDEATKMEIRTIWSQYEERNCADSKLVKDLDRYEMIQQACEYEEAHGVDLTEFFSDINKIEHPVVKQWAVEIIERRQKRALATTAKTDKQN